MAQNLPQFKLPSLPKFPSLIKKPEGILGLETEKEKGLTFAGGGPLFQQPIIEQKIAPILPELRPKEFIGDPESKVDLIKNTILGLPEATFKTLPFLKLLREPAPATFSGRLQAIGNEAADFIRGIATLVIRPGISAVSLLKDEPIEQQIKNIPVLGQVPTYERTAYEQLMIGVSPLEVGISLGAEAAITTGIIGAPALKMTQILKPKIITKTSKVTLSRQDISDITTGRPVSDSTLNAFKKAVQDGVEIGKALREKKPVIVKTETPNAIGEILYRPIGKGLFERIIPMPKEKPVSGRPRLPGLVPMEPKPAFPVGLRIEKMKPVGKPEPKVIPKIIEKKPIVKKITPKVVREFVGDVPSEFIRKREYTLLKERIKNIQRLAISEASKKAKIQQLKNEFGIQIEKAVRKEQIKTLKVGITERFKGMAKGIREGTIFTGGQIKNTQEELIKIIKESGLEAKDQSKFISTIKNIQTPIQLQKALPVIESRITENIESEVKREVQTLINRELKYTKPIKVGDKRVGKYDYESNKFFDGLRKNNSITQESAQLKLNEMPTENMSEIDIIKTRFLSLKANGMKSSLELYDKVIFDIQRMKSAGVKAKDDATFEKIINRQEKIDEVSGKIAERKGDKKSIITKAENLYREGFTNTYAMISSIAGRDIAFKYDPQLLENRKDTAIFYVVKNMAETGVKIFETKNRKEFEKILQDMSSKDFKLVDRDGLETEIGKMEMIDIYNSVKNDLIKERYYNAFGEDQIKSLLTNLSAKEMELADTMQELVQGYRKVLNERSIEITGRDVGTVENYWPSTSEYEANIFDDIKMQGETPSAMKARAKSSLIFPVPKNAWLKMLKHVNQGEHVTHLSRRYEELKRIFTNRTIKNQISNKFGENIYNSLNQHIDYISLNKTTEKLDMIANVYDKMLNNWVKAKIVAPTVFARQLGSMLNYMEDMPAGEFGKYFAQGLSKPKETFDFMWKNASFLEARFNRGYSEAMRDALKGANSLSVNIGSFTKATTVMVRTGDITAIVYGGYATVMSELAKHGNMQEAIDVFETRTLHSQQSGVSSSLSHFQNSSNPFAKTLLRFKNTLNQYARKQGDAIISFRNKDISGVQFAKTTFIYSVYAPIIYILLGWGVTQGFKAIGRAMGGDDKEEDSLASDIIEQLFIHPFQVVPFLDDLSSYVYGKIAGKKTYGVFQTPMADELATAIQKMGKKEVSFMDWIYAIGALQEPGTAIPTQAFLRYYKYIFPEKKKAEKGLPGLPALPSLPSLPALPKLPSFSM